MASSRISTSRMSVSHFYKGVPIPDSHPECNFCDGQFNLLDQAQCLTEKKKLLKGKGAMEVDKEEEYFRMSLLSLQLVHKHNPQVLALDPKYLYKQALK